MEFLALLSGDTDVHKRLEKAFLRDGFDKPRLASIDGSPSHLKMGQVSLLALGPQSLIRLQRSSMGLPSTGRLQFLQVTARRGTWLRWTKFLMQQKQKHGCQPVFTAPSRWNREYCRS